MHRLFAVLLIRQHSATACGAPGAPSGSGTALTQSPTWSPLGGDSAGAQQGTGKQYLLQSHAGGHGPRATCRVIYG